MLLVRKLGLPAYILNLREPSSLKYRCFYMIREQLCLKGLDVADTPHDAQNIPTCKISPYLAGNRITNVTLFLLNHIRF